MSKHDLDHQFKQHHLEDALQKAEPVKRVRGRKKPDTEEKSATPRQGVHVEEELKQIYENEDGTMPDMRHIDRRGKRRFRRAATALVFSVAFLAGAAWVGFFVLQPRSTFDEDDIVFSVAGPESVSAGESARYRIRYRNAGTVPLDGASLQMRYPEGFVFAESSRPSLVESHDSWDVGTLDPDESGYIDVVGIVYGTVGKEQSFRAFLDYTPANFSSEFQKVATTRVAVTEAPIAVSLLGASEVISGAETEIVLTVTPASGAALPYLAVELLPSDFFVKKSALPAAASDAPFTWRFDALTGEEVVKVTGTFIARSETDTAPLMVILRGWKDAARTGEGYVYAEAKREVKITATALTVSLAVNGTTKALPVSPSDILNVSLLVRNGGTTPLDSVVVRAVFDAPSVKKQSILEWAAIDDPLDGTVSGEQLNADMRRGVIVWDATKIPELKRLEAGEEVPIDFHLPVKSAGDTDLSDFKLTGILASAEAQSGRGKDKQIIGANPIPMTLLSDTTLDVIDEVNETPDGREVHMISWIVENTFHDLSDIRVEAEFYGDILVSTTTMEVAAGEAMYDPATKKLVWTIPAMPTSIDVLVLQVPVILLTRNPTQTNLTSKAVLNATDAIAGVEILQAGDEILLQ